MSAAPLSVLDLLTRTPEEPTWQSLAESWAAYVRARAGGRTPFEAAVDVAVLADRLGQAFGVGYTAALERLVPGVGLPCALCATEKAGNAPRAIAATLEADAAGYRLRGEKSFVTFGTLAKTLLVVARVGEQPDGRPDLAVVRLPSDRAGIEVEPLPPTKFVPEVTHARLALADVEVRPEERLPGDGYLRYLKPFRTIEDVHVVGATLAYVIGWARRTKTAESLVADLSAQLLTLAALADAEPLDPRTHLVLHGCYASFSEVAGGPGLSELLEAASNDERSRWMRDRALLQVAATAREARFEAALRSLGLRTE